MVKSPGWRHALLLLRQQPEERVSPRATHALDGKVETITEVLEVLENEPAALGFISSKFSLVVQRARAQIEDFERFPTVDAMHGQLIGAAGLGKGQKLTPEGDLAAPTMSAVAEEEAADDTASRIEEMDVSDNSNGSAAAAAADTSYTEQERIQAKPLSSSGALLGSHSTMRVPGRLSRSVCPTPSSVPPVPYAVTKQSSCRPSKARTISGPVVWRWIHAFASLSN